MLERAWRLLRAGGAFVFPSVCLWCGRGLSLDGGKFCRDCREELVPAPGPRCQVCSAPVGPNLETSAGCIHCREDRYAFTRVFSLGVYDGALRGACLRFKRRHDAPLAAGLADLFWEQEGESLAELNPDLVVPVPHHWTDRLFRPPQSPTTLADRLGHFLKVPVERHILRKKRRTPRQLSLEPTARRHNLRSAFEVSGRARFDGERILLADDVLTTGTTAHRASRLLLQAGAGKVDVAVLARGIGV
jgi:ComF family protein